MKYIKLILVLAALAAGTLLYGQGFQMPETTVNWKVSAEHVRDSLYRVTLKATCTLPASNSMNRRPTPCPGNFMKFPRLPTMKT